MAILKSKVAQALKKPEPAPKTEVSDTVTTINNALSQQLQQLLKPKKVQAPKKKAAKKAVKAAVHSDISSTCSSPVKKERSPNKNIVKNYARAMINFALSELAVPYLELHIEKQEEKLTLAEFKKFLQDQKEKINSIKTLRELLLITDDDETRLVAYKEVFRDICETFVKMFSVNWIFSSKLSDKTIHLKYRFKMLRRIRNPEQFTYLENFNKRG